MKAVRIRGLLGRAGGRLKTASTRLGRWVESKLDGPHGFGTIGESPKERAILAVAEMLARTSRPDESLAALRQLGLDAFARVSWAMPSSRYPGISSVLAAAPSVETQKLWTGDAGEVLVRQSCEFLSSIATRTPWLTPRGSRDRRVLDYGCGYGRLLRLMQHYVDARVLYGCDPWDLSLTRCAEDGVKGDLRTSDRIPTRLPFDDGSFDLVYAFSVFTHLSRTSAIACLAAIRRATKHGGTLVLTIRPVEFWNTTSHLEALDYSALVKAHTESGFAFLPHPTLAPIDGEVPYGDASMTLDFLRGIAPGWAIADTHVNPSDAFQKVIFLRAV